MRRSLNDVLAEARRESIREPGEIRASIEVMGEVPLYELLCKGGFCEKDTNPFHDNYIFMAVIISYEALMDLTGEEIVRGLKQIKLRDFCCMADYLDKNIDKKLTEGLLCDFTLIDIYGKVNREVGAIIHEAGVHSDKRAKVFARINTGVMDTMLNFPEEYDPGFDYGKNRICDYLLEGGVAGVFKLCKNYDIHRAIENFAEMAVA